MVVYIYGTQRGNPDMGHVAIPLTRLPSHQYDAATYNSPAKNAMRRIKVKFSHYQELFDRSRRKNIE
jgi:hypothetical protein